MNFQHYAALGWFFASPYETAFVAHGWLEKENSEPIIIANKPSIAPYSVAFCHSPTHSVEVAMENRNFLI